MYEERVGRHVRGKLSTVRRVLRQRRIAIVNQVLLHFYRTGRGGRERVDSRLLETLRAEFGEAFAGYIDWRDEMYQIVYDNMSADGRRSPGSTYGRSRKKKQRTYFSVGRQCRDDLEVILAKHCVRLGEISSLLEFASGYGRVTRFLVTRIGPERVWVADVSADALEINSTCFGTTPRLSTGKPADFECERHFEVVFAGMVFSHFSIDLWVPWLQRLYALVEPAGLLVFSTMGADLVPKVGADQYLIDDEGFWFIPENETAGRLEEASYGNTFVSESWVRRQIEQNDIGQLTSASPKGLVNWQDVYVIQRPA